MKLNQTLTIAALVAGGLFASLPLQAQDAPKDKPAGDQPAAAPGGPGMRRPGMMTIDSLSKQLDLTEDQKAKIKPILEDMQKKMSDLRKDASVAQEDRRAKMKEIRDGVSAKFKEILTAEQFAKWEKMGPGNRRPGAGAPPPAAPAGGDKAKN